MRHARDCEGDDRELPFYGESIRLHSERRQGLLSLAKPATLVNTDGMYARTWMASNPPALLSFQHSIDTVIPFNSRVREFAAISLLPLPCE